MKTEHFGLDYNIIRISFMPKANQQISERGIISRQTIELSLAKSKTKGIKFLLSKNNNLVEIRAEVSNVRSTQRNTVLADPKGLRYLCLVEHFMAAAALSFVDSLELSLDADELPFGDGSALFWMQALEDFAQPWRASSLSLDQEIHIQDPEKPERFISAYPSKTNCQLIYRLDMRQHLSPIGLQEYHWTSSPESRLELASARTFAREEENQLLGLSSWVLGYTDDAFTQPLRHPLEPAQHKALDLLGDLYLSGLNPLDIQMKVISSQGGHSLNILMAEALAQHFNC